MLLWPSTCCKASGCTPTCKFVKCSKRGMSWSSAGVMGTMCGHHVSNAHMSASRLTAPGSCAQPVCLAKIIDASIFRNSVWFCGWQQALPNHRPSLENCISPTRDTSAHRCNHISADMPPDWVSILYAESSHISWPQAARFFFYSKYTNSLLRLTTRKNDNFAEWNSKANCN